MYANCRHRFTRPTQNIWIRSTSSGWGRTLTLLIQSVCLFHSQTRLQTSLLAGPSSVLRERRGKQRQTGQWGIHPALIASLITPEHNRRRRRRRRRRRSRGRCLTAEASGSCLPEHVENTPVFILFWMSCASLLKIQSRSEPQFDRKAMQVWEKCSPWLWF